MLFFFFCIPFVVGAVLVVKATAGESISVWMLIIGFLLMGVAFVLAPVSMGIKIHGW